MLQQQEQRNNVSFLKRVSTGRGNFVYLMQGEDQGKHAWYYLLVDKLKLSILQHDVHVANGGELDLEKYGKIIRFGWGKEPPAAIKQYIEDNYG